MSEQKSGSLSGHKGIFLQFTAWLSQGEPEALTSRRSQRLDVRPLASRPGLQVLLTLYEEMREGRAKSETRTAPAQAQSPVLLRFVQYKRIIQAKVGLTELRRGLMGNR